jgi:hypothetical protein
MQHSIFAMRKNERNFSIKLIILLNYEGCTQKYKTPVMLKDNKFKTLSLSVTNNGGF